MHGFQFEKFRCCDAMDMYVLRCDVCVSRIEFRSRTSEEGESSSGDKDEIRKEKVCNRFRLIVMFIICDRLNVFFLSFVLLLCSASAVKRVWSRIPDPRRGNAIDLSPRRTRESR